MSNDIAGSCDSTNTTPTDRLSTCIGDAMKFRLITVATAATAIGMLAGCGSTGSAAPSTTVVTVTTVVAAPSTTADEPATDEASTPTVEVGTDETVAPAPATTNQPVERGTGASAYVGHYQRHESTLDLAANQTGTLLQGASAVDVETWSITWKPAAQGITITYDRLVKKYGKGLEAGLAPGRTFTAQFTTGETGNQVLATSAIPPAIIASIWCLPGRSSPECGA